MPATSVKRYATGDPSGTGAESLRKRTDGKEERVKRENLRVTFFPFFLQWIWGGGAPCAVQ